MKRDILIVRGIPGSGKSTLAQRYVDTGFKRVNKDDLRFMLDNYTHNPDDEHMLNEIQSSIIKMMMGFKRNIVIDNTHTRDRWIRDLVKLIGKQQEWMIQQNIDSQYTIQLFTVSTPIEECLSRNEIRERKVGEDVVRRMHSQLNESQIHDFVLDATKYKVFLS